MARFANPRGQLMPVPTAVPPRGSPLDAVLDGLCVAAELLAERHRSGVHQMRAAGLHHCLEAALLAPQLLREVLERGDQVA